MSMHKFETTYGLTYDKVIERMKELIDHEKFIRCDFDCAQYHWVIGGAVAAVMRKNFKQNLTSILGINVEVVDWNPRNISSIFLNINTSEPKLRRVNYNTRTNANYTNKHTISHVEIIPKRVIFNDPATIVFWCDGSKTVVKAKDEMFDPEKGLAMAYAKKASGNTGSYYNEFKKWIPKEKKEETAEVSPKLCRSCKYRKLPTIIEPCRSCFYDNSKTYWVKADE